MSDKKAVFHGNLDLQNEECRKILQSGKTVSEFGLSPEEVMTKMVDSVIGRFKSFFDTQKRIDDYMNATKLTLSQVDDENMQSPEMIYYIIKDEFYVCEAGRAYIESLFENAKSSI